VASADTIFALGTPPGVGAIAVVRISGPRAHHAVGALTSAPVSADRTMRLRTLRDPESGEILDRGLAVAFPQASSPTGEPYAELHVHGGVAAPAAVLRALTALPGLRLAEPGAFARRALQNERLDLTQVEGVADLVAAQTEAQRRQAVRLVEGTLSARVETWRRSLIHAQALLEASMDFADEDLPDALVPDALADVEALAAGIAKALRGAAAGDLVRDGLEIAIVGPPNAGKSSLVNLLGGRDIALTSPYPGTTRDVIELRCSVGAHLVIFLDTAGIRATTDPVERAGVALAQRRAAAADLRIVVWAPDCAQDPAPGPDDILVWNKCDVAPGPGINISALQGEGVERLLAEVARRLRVMTAEADVVVRARHHKVLREALACLERAVAHRDALELCAEDVRLAARALDQLIGRIDCEAVLGEIFSQLCIGK